MERRHSCLVSIDQVKEVRFEVKEEEFLTVSRRLFQVVSAETGEGA